VEELHGDPTVGPRPKVWIRGQKWKSGAEDGAPERLRCGTVQKEASHILQRVSAVRCMKNSPSVLSCIPVGKKTSEGCDRGSDIGTVHSG